MKKHLKVKRNLKAKVGSIARGRLVKTSGQQSSPTAKIESGSSLSDDRETLNELPMTAEEFDRRFDDGESLDSLGVDLSKARRPGLEIRRITIDLPTPFLDRLDHWAAVRGMTRQALIKSWLYDRLEQQAR